MEVERRALSLISTSKTNHRFRLWIPRLLLFVGALHPEVGEIQGEVLLIIRGEVLVEGGADLLVEVP